MPLLLLLLVAVALVPLLRPKEKRLWLLEAEALSIGLGLSADTPRVGDLAEGLKDFEVVLEPACGRWFLRI